MNIPLHRFLLGIPARHTYSCGLSPHQRRGVPAHSGREEATMTLAMRLNVLAAIFSFAFLTAIVVGML
jgi:hypothetical protein